MFGRGIVAGLLLLARSGYLDLIGATTRARIFRDQTDRWQEIIPTGGSSDTGSMNRVRGSLKFTVITDASTEGRFC